MPANRISRRRTIRRLVILGCIAACVLVVGFLLHTINTFQNSRVLSGARADGLEAYREGDMDLAVEKLSLYHARRANDPEVVLALANAEAGRPDASRGDLIAAAAHATLAAELNPTSVDARLLELRLRSKLVQHTERLAAADRVIALDPDNAEAAVARIQSLAALGRRDEALTSAQSLVASHPDDPENHRLVLILLSGLDPATASNRIRDYASEIETSHPEDPRFLILAAQAYTQVRDYTAASATTKRLLEPSIAARLDPDSLRSATQLLDILGNRDGAETLLSRFQNEQPGSPDIAAVVIERAFKQGQMDIAAERAAHAIKTADSITPDLAIWASVCEVDAPTDSLTGASLHILQGLQALQKSNPTEASLHLDQALEEEPTNHLAMHLFAAAIERVGNANQAARVRERLLRIAPDYTVARLALIQSLLDRGRASQAASLARIGLEVDPTSGGLLLAYALATTERASQGEASRSEIESALNIATGFDDPEEANDPNAEATPATPIRARLYIAAGRMRDASRAIDRVLASDNADPRALLALADDADNAGLPVARNLRARAELASISDPSVLLAVAIRMNTEGRTDDAFELFDVAMRASDRAEGIGSRGVRLARAAFLDQIGSPNAQAELAALLDENPTDPVVQTLVLESEAAWADEQLVTAAVTGLRNTTSDTSDAWRLHEAKRLLRFGDTDSQAAQAVQILEPIASRNGADPLANVLLAEALRRLGDPDAAIEQLARAADAGLEQPGLLLRLGWLFHSRGDIEAARRRARTLATIEPIDPALRRERVALLIAVGLTADAARDAATLEQLGTPDDLAVAATVAALAGDDTALTRRLDRIAELDNPPARVIATAGDLLVRSGRVADAFKLIEALRPESDDPGFARAEAAILLAAQQTDRGLQRLGDAFQLSRDTADAARAARALAAAGRTDDALALIDNAQQTNPDDPRLTVLADAIRLESVGLSPTATGLDAAARTVAAVQRYIAQPGDGTRMLEDLRWITGEHPTYFAAWALLTDQLLAAGRTEEAVDTAITASRLMPSDPQAARLAVSALLNVRPLTRALGAARDWQTRSRPDTYEADTTTAALLIRLGRIEEATSLLERWADRISGDQGVPPVLFRLYTASLVNSGRADEAITLFERRTQTNPRWLEHRIEIARDLIQYHNEPELARDWITRLPAEATQTPETSLRVAQAAVDLADRTGDQGDLTTAIAASDLAFEKSSAETARSATILRAQSHRLNRDAQGAARIISEQIAADPDDAVSLSLLVHAGIESGADPADVLDTAERSADASPTPSVVILDALGRAQLYAGSPEVAEQTFRRAIAADTESPDPRVGLAEALAAQQRIPDAERILRDSRLREQAQKRTLLADRLDALRQSLERQSRAG